MKSTLRPASSYKHYAVSDLHSPEEEEEKIHDFNTDKAHTWPSSCIYILMKQKLLCEKYLNGMQVYSCASALIVNAKAVSRSKIPRHFGILRMSAANFFPKSKQSHLCSAANVEHTPAAPHHKYK